MFYKFTGSARPAPASLIRPPALTGSRVLDGFIASGVNANAERIRSA
jgi:hypothetical protein